VKKGGDAEGYLLLHKHPGLTSFGALGQVKRALGTTRVGHTGTLDSFAEGLLIILVGSSTRLVPWFTGCDKTYEGIIRFGTQTDTLDPLGSVVFDAPSPSREKLEEALSYFRGNILQSPPLYSAVHIDGHRAHELARSGLAPEMKPRWIRIHSLELESYNGIDAQIRVVCSKGTYIRSLARDIALACASRAHLFALKRTAVAGFTLDEAINPEKATKYKNKTNQQEEILALLRQNLRPLDEHAFEALKLPFLHVQDDIAHYMSNGRSIDPKWIEGFQEANSLGIFSLRGVLLAIINASEGCYSYKYVNPKSGQTC